MVRANLLLADLTHANLSGATITQHDWIRLAGSIGHACADLNAPSRSLAGAVAPGVDC